MTMPRHHIAAIKRVFDEKATHVFKAGSDCCSGHTMARQIPDLIAEIERLHHVVDLWAPKETPDE